MERIELHAHTRHTYKDGIIKIDELVEWVQNKQMRAVAITDFNSIEAFAEFQREINRFNENENVKIKAIYGTEVCLLEDDNEQLSHATILVKNQAGLFNLYKMVTEASLNISSEPIVISRELLEFYRDGLLIGSGTADSEVFHALLDGAEKTELEKILGFYDYLELMPVDCLEYFVRDEACTRIKSISDFEQIYRNAVRIADKLKIPAVAVSKAMYLKKQDNLARNIILYSKGVNVEDTIDNAYIRTTKEMLKAFSFLSSATAYQIVVVNSNLLADMVEEVSPIQVKQELPFMEGYSIREDCFQRATMMYGYPLPHEVESRLEWEIDNTEKYGYGSLYKSISLAVHGTLKDYEIHVRGCMGASCIGYLLGITGIDPIKYKLAPYFYLGIDGDKLPYFEIDVADSKYDDVLENLNLNDLYSVRGAAFYAMDEKRENLNDVKALVMNYCADKNIQLSRYMIRKVIDKINYSEMQSFSHRIICVSQGTDILKYSFLKQDGNGNLVANIGWRDIDNQVFSVAIHKNGEGEILKQLSKITGISASEIDLEDKELIRYFSSLCNNYEERSYITKLIAPYIEDRILADQMITVLEPSTFEEYVKVFSAVHGTAIWEDNQRELAETGLIKFDNLIADREDIYDTLINAGFDVSFSYRVAERVRKGKGIEEGAADLIRTAGVGNQFVDICNRIKYMFSRPHAISYMLRVWRLIYYKIYYPDIYEKCEKTYVQKNVLDV